LAVLLASADRADFVMPFVTSVLLVGLLVAGAATFVVE
jgi:hypothetical protein